jgi:hypothetical protein
MMDMGEGGMDLDGLIAAVTALAEKYPGAVFIPGHGPVASARDLKRYAAFLKALRAAVSQAIKAGKSEEQAAEEVDLTTFNLQPLPTFHDNHLCWSGAAIDVKWVYQLEARTRLPRQHCTF